MTDGFSDAQHAYDNASPEDEERADRVQRRKEEAADRRADEREEATGCYGCDKASVSRPWNCCTRINCSRRTRCAENAIRTMTR